LAGRSFPLLSSAVPRLKDRTDVRLKRCQRQNGGDGRVISYAGVSERACMT